MFNELVTAQQLIASGLLSIGDGYRAKNEELSDKGVPFARAGNINDGFRFTDADKFPEQDLPKVGEKVSRPGDIVFTSKGTVGRYALVTENTPTFVYSPQLCYWRSRDHNKIDPVFMFYYMQGYHFRSQINGIKGQTDMADYVSLRDQKGIELLLPEIDQQRRIASILIPLDEKIELNRKQNCTLEAIAQALFKRWFVEFEFPDENGRPYKSSSGAMQPSELGEIPVGWEVKLLSDVTTYLGRGITPVYVQEGGVTVLNQRCIRDGWINNEPARRHDVEARKIEGRELQSGDVLVNSTGMGTLGRVAQAVVVDGAVVVDSHITVVRADPRHVSPEYLGVCLRLKEREIEHMAEGSTGQTELSRAKLGELPVVVPGDGVLRIFTEIVADLNKKRALNWSESLSLGLARDTLLPKLMSGELRVPEARLAVEKAS